MKQVVIKKSEALQEAQGELKNDVETLAERLLEEKYSKPAYENIALHIDEVYNDPSTKRRAINTMIKMDNQERFFEKLSRYLPEATFTANFGATPQAIIRAIRVANPNSIIEDICDVQTLSSIVGIIGYIKPVFSRSIRGATAGNLLVESKVKDYGAENIDEAIDTGDASQSLFTSSDSAASILTYLPIRPNKVTIQVSGIEVATDNGSGRFLNIGSGTTITEGATSAIVYSTGAYSIQFASAPANAAITINKVKSVAVISGLRKVFSSRSNMKVTWKKAIIHSN